MLRLEPENLWSEEYSKKVTYRVRDGQLLSGLDDPRWGFWTLLYTPGATSMPRGFLVGAVEVTVQVGTDNFTVNGMCLLSLQ